jgi:hypothetical protein
LDAPNVAVFLPSGELRDYITFFYTVATDIPVDDFLYPEWGNVRFGLSGDWHVGMEGYSLDPQGNILFGHTDQSARVTATSGRCVGFGMTPIGWQQFIGGSAAQMANRCRPLASELGEEADKIHSTLLRCGSDDQCIQFLEGLLLSTLRRRAPEQPDLVALDRALKERPAKVTTDVTPVSHPAIMRVLG